MGLKESALRSAVLSTCELPQHDPLTMLDVKSPVCLTEHVVSSEILPLNNAVRKGQGARRLDIEGKK